MARKIPRMIILKVIPRGMWEGEWGRREGIGGGGGGHGGVLGGRYFERKETMIEREERKGGGRSSLEG